MPDDWKTKTNTRKLLGFTQLTVSFACRPPFRTPFPFAHSPKHYRFGSNTNAAIKDMEEQLGVGVESNLKLIVWTRWPRILKFLFFLNDSKRYQGFRNTVWRFDILYGRPKGPSLQAKRLCEPDAEVRSSIIDVSPLANSFPTFAGNHHWWPKTVGGLPNIQPHYA